VRLGRRNQVAAKYQALAPAQSILSYAETQVGPVVATETGIISRSFIINWYDMFQASFNPPELSISYHSETGNKTLLLQLDPQATENEFANLIRAKITTNVIAQTKLEYESELFVTFSARRKSETELKFVVTADPGIVVTSEQFQLWAKQELAQFKETFGF
jgi:hypothetical protein